MNCLAVGLGGFAGAVLRYLIGLIPTGETMIFPAKTFCINVIGCIVIGAITVLAAKLSVPPRLILFLKVGVCGGFTTFSTFALESSDLIRDGHMGIALCYVLLSVLVGVLAIFAVEYRYCKISCFLILENKDPFLQYAQLPAEWTYGNFNIIYSKNSPSSIGGR